jgi:hypothetical protein
MDETIMTGNQNRRGMESVRLAVGLIVSVEIYTSGLNAIVNR